MKKRLFLVVLSFILVFCSPVVLVNPAYAGGDDIPFSINGLPEFSAFVFAKDGVAECRTLYTANVDHINVIEGGVLVGKMNPTPVGFIYGVPLPSSGTHYIQLVAFSSADELTAKTVSKSYCLTIINGNVDYTAVPTPYFDVNASVNGAKVTVAISNISWGTVNHATVVSRQGEVIGEMTNNAGTWSFSKDNVQNGAYTWEVYAYSVPGYWCNAEGYSSVSFNVTNGSNTAVRPEIHQAALIVQVFLRKRITHSQE